MFPENGKLQSTYTLYSKRLANFRVIFNTPMKKQMLKSQLIGSFDQIDNNVITMITYEHYVQC